ncbi:hypothetical protein AU210_016345 [Fusarium oxysporum f. sp. radicis-cucumerinum]|uniref:RRM domain-containing protein n=1 Tax=Fusarium oxysporum f. sp. radicis-cucumerinum TaxID=327505 RepID=A0A2H3FSP2_FUSOX|nr:hypothetical protein AU210_016345 [Fusarium oxysporum f. sp. radicis-cucumerinum]
MNSQFTLRKKTLLCKKRFRTCLELPGLNEGDWIEEKSAEFNFWASKLNAEKHGPDSLDSRLTLRPDVRKHVASVLDGLMMALGKCEEIGRDRSTRDSEPTHAEDGHPSADGEGRAASPWSDMGDSTGSQPESPAESNNDKEHLDLYKDHRFYIGMNIESLLKVYAAIKKSGPQFIHRFADEDLIKAEKKYQDEKARLGEHVVLYGNDTPIGDHERFRRFLTRLILQNGYIEGLFRHIDRNIQLYMRTCGANRNDAYPLFQTKLLILFRACLYDPARLTPVQRRLIDANVVRRNRLIYVESVGKVHTEEAKNQHEPLVHRPRAKRKASQESCARDYKRMLSSTLVQTPSMPRPEGYQRLVSQPAAVLESSFTITGALSSLTSTESVATNMSATLANIDYPKPASLRKGGSKVRVDNIRQDLSEKDLMELFEPNDRVGRSKGTADMTYERKEEAEDALRQIDGANTCKLADGNSGQPIQLTLLSSRGHSDTANREPFPCSYCPLILPHTYTKKAKWRAHVVRDLYPYICIFEDCKSPDEMYASTHEWMSHLAKFHSTMEWVCLVCSRGDGTSTVSFNNRMDLGKHISAVHKDFASDETELLIEGGERPTGIQRIACPLCRRGLVTSETSTDRNQGLVHAGNRTQEVGLRQLEEDEHIATHLHEFALHAFPWPDETKDEPDVELLKSNSTASSRPEITFQASSHTSYFGNGHGFYNPHEILEIAQTLRQELTALDGSSFGGLLDWIVGKPESVIQRLDYEALTAALNECRMTISHLQLWKNSRS